MLQLVLHQFLMVTQVIGICCCCQVASHLCWVRVRVICPVWEHRGFKRCYRGAGNRHSDAGMFSLSPSVLTEFKRGFLSLSLYVRCSNPLIILMALCWTCSSASMSVLCWEPSTGHRQDSSWPGVTFPL